MLSKKYLKNFAYKSLKNIALMINRILKPLSITLIRLKKDLEFPVEATQRDIEIIKYILNSNSDKKLSMVTVDRLMAVISATKYIIENNIKGDFVECGVWKGGNLILFKIISDNWAIYFSCLICCWRKIFINFTINFSKFGSFKVKRHVDFSNNYII